MPTGRCSAGHANGWCSKGELLPRYCLQGMVVDLGGLQLALEGMLGVPVDVITLGDLPAGICVRVVSEACSL